MNNLIVLSITSEFAALCVHCLAALEQHTRTPVLIWHTDLSDKQKKKLRAHPNVTLEGNPLPGDFRAPVLSCHSHVGSSRSLYGRFELWGPEFDRYDNILYMDVDILALSSLDDIVASDQFYAEIDPHATNHEKIFKDDDNLEVKRKLAEDKIVLPKCVSNAGFFVLPKAYRTSEQHDYLYYLIDRYSDDIKWADQSILSLWMAKNDIATIENYEFNYQIREIINPNSAFNLPQIKGVHFNGIPGSGQKEFFMKLVAKLERYGLLRKSILGFVTRLHMTLYNYQL